MGAHYGHLQPVWQCPGCLDWEGLENLTVRHSQQQRSPHLITHVSRLPEGEHLLLIRGSGRLWGKLTEAQV